MPRPLSRSQLKVRMVRALSGLSQDDFERESGVANVAAFENGQRPPSAAQLDQMAGAAGLTPDDCEEMLRDYEARVLRNGGTRKPPRRLAAGGVALSLEAVIDCYDARIAARDSRLPGLREAQRQEAREAWERLRPLKAFKDLAVVVKRGREYQTWAMVELLCRESEGAADAGRAVDLAGLAVTIAEGMRLAEGWGRRVRGYALRHLAAARRRAGLAEDADVAQAEGDRLWEAGWDPEGVLALGDGAATQ